MSKSNVARGFVFEDTNQHATYQVGKKGIPNVLVSNQREVVRTDKNGYFTIPLPENSILFICKPDGYALPLNAFNQPQFYYKHFPKGTPAELSLKYPGIEPTGPLPDLLHFPLIPCGKKTNFSMVAMGDIQPKTVEDISFFRDMIAPELMQQDIDFFFSMGDLTWDDLSKYPLIRDNLKSIGVPYFPVCGNHDINFQVPDQQYSDITFQKFFGPSYYSFDHGQVHFMVLNDIGYEGWNETEDRHGKCYGWLDDQQLQWIENDLQYVPEDHLVVIVSHIPIYTAILPTDDYRNILNREKLFKLLRHRKRLLALAAHTHFVEQVDLREGGWQGDAPFPLLIAGAACGAWWKGPRDYHGLPVKMGMDGTPNGFFRFSFKGNDYTFDFVPAGLPAHHQVGIRFPEAEISSTDILTMPICANIYAASAKSDVKYRIDQGTWLPMEQIMEEDPYVRAFLEKHRDHYPAWMKVRRTAHLWKAPHSTEILPGLHSIEVVATEPDGRQFAGRRIFQVTANKKTNASSSARVNMSVSL